jgi:hypothetical protein
MTQTVLKFWETTWGKLSPGDYVKAPNGSIWRVSAAIISDGAGEWCLVAPGLPTLWTPQKEAGTVMAARGGVGAVNPFEMERAIKLLETVLGAEVIPSA